MAMYGLALISIRYGSTVLTFQTCIVTIRQVEHSIPFAQLLEPLSALSRNYVWYSCFTSQDKNPYSFKSCLPIIMNLQKKIIGPCSPFASAAASLSFLLLNKKEDDLRFRKCSMKLAQIFLCSFTCWNGPRFSLDP